MSDKIRTSEDFIPISVEIVDLMIDMLSADARRSYMESEISKLIASKMQGLHPSESAGVPSEDYKKGAEHATRHILMVLDFAGVKGAVWVKVSGNTDPPHTWRGYVHTNQNGTIRGKLATFYKEVGFVIDDGFDGEFVIEWLDESPAAAQSLPPDVIDKILKARDALAKRDIDEAYHQLYAIASPYFDKLKPWAEMEAKRLPAAAQSGEHPHQSLFDQYHAIKEKIGKLGYNTFIHSKEVEEYREWLRNDKYKHRLEWFEKEYPNGLYSKDNDGELFGINIMTKKFLAEADAAYGAAAAQSGKEVDAETLLKWIKENGITRHSNGHWYKWQPDTSEKFFARDNEELYDIYKQQNK